MKKNRYWVVAAILLGWCAWQLAARYRPGPDAARQFVQAVEGDSIFRPDGRQWNTSGAGAIVITINHGCPFCVVSKPFESELEEQGKVHGIPTVYAIPQQDRNDGLAQELRQEGKSVIRTQPAQFGITAVPTFMRVSDQGVVQAMWRGTVPQDRRRSLLSALTTGRTTRAYDIIPSTELGRYAANSDYQILALSKWGPVRSGSSLRVIPVNQLEVRAPYELDRHLGVVLDCASASSARDCQTAAWLLFRLRFARIIAAGLPARSPSLSFADRIRRVL